MRIVEPWIKVEKFDGIEIMKKKGIIFIDKYHILSVLENDNINLWEHLKKVEEGILDD